MVIIFFFSFFFSTMTQKWTLINKIVVKRDCKSNTCVRTEVKPIKIYILAIWPKKSREFRIYKKQNAQFTYQPSLMSADWFIWEMKKGYCFLFFFSNMPKNKEKKDFIIYTNKYNTSIYLHAKNHDTGCFSFDLLMESLGEHYLAIS